MKYRIVMKDEKRAEVSKTFEKKARIFGSEEYNVWMAYRQEHQKYFIYLCSCEIASSSVAYCLLSGGTFFEWQHPPTLWSVLELARTKYFTAFINITSYFFGLGTILLVIMPLYLLSVKENRNYNSY